ncbi:MAG: 4'-phosphopantetheinyl transferase superfamily protein [Oscillatoria sp. PMC 1051.18]|nr:4'-phosphopantetheinyl transferase superfamily protein [Oscillatoria sp. PMC 1050.18]MEC5029466.1 4'-phosphopantetheinyl transferase superfamily protein [Oscillatoria sp. PMC 1051.18]
MNQVIVGHKLEILSVNSLTENIEKMGENFAMKYFTNRERNTPNLGSTRNEYFAGRLVAKQAVLKILGGGNIPWIDIEVQRLLTGEPAIFLYRKAKVTERKLGIIQWFVSITHTSSYAAATVLAIGDFQLTVNS